MVLISSRAFVFVVLFLLSGCRGGEGEKASDEGPAPGAGSGGEVSPAIAPTMDCDQRTSRLVERLAAFDRGEEVAIPDPGAADWVVEMVAQVREATDLPERAVRAAKLAERSIRGCPPLSDVFGAAAQMDIAERIRVFHEQVPVALRSCECAQVDVDGVEAFLIIASEIGRAAAASEAATPETAAGAAPAP